MNFKVHLSLAQDLPNLAATLLIVFSLTLVISASALAVTLHLMRRPTFLIGI